MIVTETTPAVHPPYPYFTEEHELIRRTVKQFCLDEIAPRAQEWEEARAYPKELFKRAAELGLFGIRIDPEWGGVGMDWWAVAAMYDALRYTDFPSLNIGFMVQSDLTIPLIGDLGTDEQKHEFMKPAIAGDRIAALAISEPGCGSDVAAMRTTAREDGGDLVITGQKLWITNGVIADFLLLAVRTSEHRHRGISLVLLPTDVKGFSVGKRIAKVGHVASDTAHLYFDECRIPASYVLGRRNHGFYYIMEHFQGERLATSLLVLSFMDRSLELAIHYGKERHAFGHPVIKNQVWRHRFAEHRASVEAARWLIYRALDLMNRKKSANREISMAKLFATDLSQRVTYDCMQMFGGFGYTTEYPIGRIWRDMRLYTIGAGTSEIMKEILAKQDGL
ncbi:MAG: acyl-CoA dehydrogenase family protein [Bryobacteraceae bacterium]|nr:acyl-CoA dehydrogenase family protein [Bryobacteraceae bacterium]